MQSSANEINKTNTKPVDFVFLHGGGQGSWVWQSTIDALQQQTDGQFGRALALNAPGCGDKRGRDTAAMDIDDVVTELLADIDTHALKNIVLVGHSQAGTILPKLVERRPELFRRVVYVSCIAPASEQTIVQQMGSGLQGANENEVGWPAEARVADPSQRYSVLFCNDMSAADTAEFLDKLGPDTWPAKTMTAANWRYDHLVDVPATYVVCVNDNVLPTAWQEKFAARLHVQKKVFIDAGHQAMNTRPHSLAEILLHEAQ